MRHTDSRTGRPLPMLARLALIAACFLLPACQSLPWQGPPRPATINHVVLVKLHDPGQAAALVAECDAAIPKIPGIVSYACGKPYASGRREVLKDYDVGLFIGFSDERSYQQYVDDPRHRALLEAWKPRCEAIRIYDVLDTSP